MEPTHLKRLSAVKSNAGVQFLTPAAFPGNHCPMHTALALSANVRGMSTLVVGTAECSIYSRNVIEKVKQSGGLHWMYVLDANEVVFGCRKGLMEAVWEMNRAGAKAIMLIMTCVPEVVGEDVEGIVTEMQPQIEARLNFIRVPHFKCNSHPSGYWKTLEAFGEMMEPLDIRFNVINVLGRSPDEDHVPMPELLKQLQARGFQLRMLAPKSEVEDFVAAPDAKLNLVLSPYMNPLAQRMNKEQGVPFFSLHECYAVDELDHLYATIAQALQISWGDAFAATREKALVLEEQVQSLLAGSRYICTGQNALMPLPLALYLTQFEMEPVLLHLEEFYPDDRKWAKVLLEQGHNPLICHMVNDREDATVLEAMEPDLSFGEILAGTGQIPCVSYLYELYGQIGYERTALLLERMLKAMQGKSQRERRGRRGAV